MTIQPQLYPRAEWIIALKSIQILCLVSDIPVDYMDAGMAVVSELLDDIFNRQTQATQ